MFKFFQEILEYAKSLLIYIFSTLNETRRMAEKNRSEIKELKKLISTQKLSVHNTTAAMDSENSENTYDNHDLSEFYRYLQAEMCGILIILQSEFPEKMKLFEQLKVLEIDSENVDDNAQKNDIMHRRDNLLGKMKIKTGGEDGESE